MPEDEPYDRTAVKELVEKCHREIGSPGPDPCTERRLPEEYRGDQAHDGAHDHADTDGNQIGDKFRIPIRTDDRKSHFFGNPTDNEEFQQECDRDHDREFMEGPKKGASVNGSCRSGDVVDNHSVDHECRHDDGVDDFLQFVLWHDKRPP